MNSVIVDFFKRHSACYPRIVSQTDDYEDNFEVLKFDSIYRQVTIASGGNRLLAARTQSHEEACQLNGSNIVGKSLHESRTWTAQ